MHSVLRSSSQHKPQDEDIMYELWLIAHIRGYRSMQRTRDRQPVYSPFPFSLLEKGTGAGLSALEAVAQQLVKGLEPLFERLARPNRRQPA